MRCVDRSCTCNRRKTRKITQPDYEDINTGAEFLIEYRYSQILTTLFIVMMYSSGLPILYLIALLTYFFQYWFDKLFCKFASSTASAQLLPEAAPPQHGPVARYSQTHEVLPRPPLPRWSLHVLQLIHTHWSECINIAGQEFSFKQLVL